MPTASYSSCITVPGTGNYLADIRRFVVDFARKWGCNDEAVIEMVQAVGEATDNIVEHAYRNTGVSPERPLRIVVTALLQDDELLVSIRDQSAVPFRPARHGDLDLDEYRRGVKPRGAGLYIIRQCVDEMQHRYIPGQGNELTLVKRL